MVRHARREGRGPALVVSFVREVALNDKVGAVNSMSV